MPSEDEDLVAGCLEGKKEAWDDFVSRFSKLIYWSIRQTVQRAPVGGVEELCDEVFQEVFKKLLEKDGLSRLRDAKHIRKFLSVIACHTAMDRLKSLSRHEKKNIFADPQISEAGAETPYTFGASTGTASDSLISREREMLISKTLESLNAKERACVEFYYVDGRTHREIAELLGFPQDTVSTVIRRAKEKIRKDFSEKGLLE